MAYSLATSYAGESLLSGFNWFDGADPSNGYVSYQNRNDAEELGLFSIDPVTNSVRLGVDHNNTYDLDEGRPSIRLESKEAYNHGLFIADFLHMPPSECGLWPAFWSYGSDWPKGGEMDIIEGANTAHHNIISAHTDDGCTQDRSQMGMFSGEQRNTDCAIGDDNIGCGYNPPADDVSSYGDSFNAIGGGVYAMQWDSDHIRVWHFARGQVPDDIGAKKPNPKNWGLPDALFGGKSCEIDDFFKDMSLVININFCGDYGNAVWGQDDRCDRYAATCPEYVANNPEAFANAYWDVRYIDAYQWDPKGANSTAPIRTTTTTTSSSSTTASSTSSSARTSAPGTSAAPTSAVATPTPVPPASNPASIGEFSHLGCFSSSSSFSSFSRSGSDGSMTLEKCTSLCAGQTYAGVSGGECHCASDLDADTRACPAEVRCSQPCPGDAGQVCGSPADGLMTVYASVQDEEHQQPPPMAASPTSDDGYDAVETVTVCRAARPTGTGAAAPTGSGVNGGGGVDVLPPISRGSARQGPSKLKVLLGAVVLGALMAL